MEEQPKNINIYLTEQNKETVLSGSTSYERYIIIANETLQIENRELSKRIKTLENNVDDLESQMDKEETSKSYMRGLLKNLAELNKLFGEVSLHRHTILKNTEDHLNKYKYKARKHLRFIEGFFALLAAIVYELYNTNTFITLVILLCIIVAFTESMLFNLTLPNCIEENEKINQLETEIKDIKDAQDYLDDYINCL
jgi:outer membrane murein-binding lipoprotein Lpp|uniref:Uncharacterized protein n=1 Tax=viral metagenome TaxID=1070528 RepID=A0A6C0CXG2_9ZZZZ